MQAYLAVQNASLATVIVRKRIYNRFWDSGNTRAGPRLVNQAGQWALPGGGVTGKETAIAAAIREFTEETGVALKGSDGDVTGTHVHGSLWTLVCFRYNKDLAELAKTITVNCMPRSSTGDSMGPKGKIKDWELSEATVVPQNQITQYLGVYDKQTKAPAPVFGDESQSIDWYAEMAKNLASAATTTLTVIASSPTENKAGTSASGQSTMASSTVSGSGASTAVVTTVVI